MGSCLGWGFFLATLLTHLWQPGSSLCSVSFCCVSLCILLADFPGHSAMGSRAGQPTTHLSAKGMQPASGSPNLVVISLFLSSELFLFPNVWFSFF
jgi:hypothetical protein